MTSTLMFGSKLLGEYLREISALSSGQVVEGLREQVIARDRGEFRRLGEILVARGYVCPSDLETALTRQSAECQLAT